MNAPEAESKKRPLLENRPAVTKRAPKRRGGCLRGSITYLVLGGLFSWFMFSIYDSWLKGGGWLEWAMAFPFFYALTWPIAVVGVLIGFILFAFGE